MSWVSWLVTNLINAMRDRRHWTCTDLYVQPTIAKRWWRNDNLWLAYDTLLCIGVNPLVSTVSRHSQFSALWWPPICGHPRIFDHLIVNYICYCVQSIQSYVRLNCWTQSYVQTMPGKMEHLVERLSPSEIFTGALLPALPHHYTPGPGQSPSNPTIWVF